MAKKLYVRNSENTEWVEIASAISEVPDISNFLTNSSASTIYATKAELSNIDALPSQTGNGGKYLSTDGTLASWEDVDLTSVINTASAAAFSAASTSLYNSFFRWQKVYGASATVITGLDDNSLDLSYTPGFEQVYINGILLTKDEDYVATNSSTITLSQVLEINDILEILYIEPFNVANIDLDNIYTESESNNIFLTQVSASNLYLTQISASSEYATKAELNNVSASGGGGGGDLIGPASSTDNAVARYDLATGKLVQNSLVTIADNGAISTPNNTGSKISFYFADVASFPAAGDSHGAVAHAHNTGKMYYAHGGAWIELSNASELTALSSEVASISGSVSSSGTFNATTDATLAGITINEIAYSAITRLEVTHSSATAYLINNQYSGNNPTIVAIAGTTIAFNLNVTGHPFLIKTAGGGANYDTGLIHVATNGAVTTGSSAQGKVTGTLYWQVPSDITGPYAYQCSIHPGMLGVITVVSPTPTNFTSLSAPTLRLSSTIDASDASGNHGLQVGQTNAENVRIDNNEILALNNGANSTLNIQRQGGQVLIAGNVVNGSSLGLKTLGPLRLESSRNAANNTRGIDSMNAKIAVNAADNRQELQIYASGDAYSANSAGGGIHLYGTNDSQHAGNIAFLTGTPNNGDARLIIAGGTGATGYVSDGVTYTRTNNDTRVTIGNQLWNWIDEKNDTGLLNLKDASSRPAIYIESVGESDGTSFGSIGIQTGRNFGIGHWSGTTYTNRLSIGSTGIVSIPGILDVAEVRETVVSNSFSQNAMTANFNNGSIHYATVAPTGNFTISLTNIPTTTSKSITMSFLITQGSTGRIPTTVNVNGASQTIRWVGGTAPTPTSSAGKIDIFNFTYILSESNVLIASANLNI